MSFICHSSLYIDLFCNIFAILFALEIVHNNTFTFNDCVSSVCYDGILKCILFICFISFIYLLIFQTWVSSVAMKSYYNKCCAFSGPARDNRKGNKPVLESGLRDVSLIINLKYRVNRVGKSQVLTD